MIEKSQLKTGLQVAYVPSHVREECEDDLSKMLKHKDTRFGFVSSWKIKDPLSSTVWCRFWSVFHPEILMTLSCSNGCDPADLFAHKSRSPEVMENILAMLRGDTLRYAWIEQKDRIRDE